MGGLDRLPGTLMRRLLLRYRAFYGSNPWHLLLMLAAFATFGYVIVTVTPAALWNPKMWWKSIAIWFVAAVILHDFVLFPLYAVADRILAIPVGGRRREPAVPVLNYVRIPALVSGLTLLVFWPGIVEQGAPTYVAATGQTQSPFLGRWLLLCAVAFVLSAVLYAVRLASAHRRRQPSGAGETALRA
jgi:hypothetical protein